MPTAVVHSMSVHPLVIPLRGKVSHATSERGVADPVVVSVELADGTIGYGETLPRPYVTGETVDSVIETVSTVLAPALLDFHPTSFPECLEALESLPMGADSTRPFPAARAAVELAMLDATIRVFDRDLSDVVSWMGLPAFGYPGSIRRVRFSGVLAAEDAQKNMRRLRKMYWGGLRDFKLKVGFPGDVERLKQVVDYLSGPLNKGRASLRLDANGAWSLDEAVAWLTQVKDLPLSGVEQPLPRGSEDDLKLLRAAVSLPFIHDESLVYRTDAERLIELGVADIFNIRISKSGGLIPALRLAGRARQAGVGIQLGCMVGETGLLSAAGIRFLQVCPDVRWAEGCFGRFLLKEDITKPSLHFGFGGRPPSLRAAGMGVSVLPEALARFREDDPITIPF